MRNRRRALVVGVLLLMLAVVGLRLILHRTIRLTPADIQADVAHQFPVERNETLYRYRLEEPTISIDPATDLVSMAVTADASAIGTSSLHARVSATGNLRYQADTGELFLDHPRALISQVDFGGMPDRYRTAASQILAQGIETYVSRNPIYRLRQGDTKAFAIRRRLKSLQIKNGEVVIELGI